MDKGEYLKTVLDQIRYIKVKETIQQELENHIEDQKIDFMEKGMDETKAIVESIREMGDPVEVGISLDQIHRPKMEWKMFLLILGLSVLGFVIQFLIMTYMGTEAYPYNIGKQAANIGIGLAVMMFFCFLDYSRIGLASKYFAAILLALLILGLVFGYMNRGQIQYIYGDAGISIYQIMYLYIPSFGGILYSYRDQGKKGLWKSVLWMVIPVFLILRVPSVLLAGSLMLIMLLQVGVAIYKGWYGLTKKGVGVIISVIMGGPFLMFLFIMLLGKEYQKMRLLVWLGLGGDMDYTQQVVRTLIGDGQWIGHSATDIKAFLPDISSNYILTYIYSYYGILACIGLLLLFGIFIYKIFGMGMKQKNQLGQIMGIGCSLVFLVQIMTYIMVNFTLIPATTVFLPFISYGCAGSIVSYALVGIMMSIYRFQNILPAHPRERNEFSKKLSRLFS